MSGMVYQWRPGTRLSLAAQAVGEEIERLRQAHNGALTPEEIVEAAHEPSSPLHDAFEWDDEKAAAEHRLSQARYLISAVITRVANADNKPVRAFVSVVDEKDRRGYTAVEVAFDDPVMRAQVIRRAWNELQSWRKRYAVYAELAEVHTLIDQQRDRDAA